MQYVATAAAGFAVSFLIRKLFPVKTSSASASTTSITLPTISEGTRLPLLIGTRKLSGNYIYCGDWRKIEHNESVSGGKGGGSSATSTSYTYTASFAIALCSANLSTGADVLRIWQNDEEVSAETYLKWISNGTMRVYTGVAGQAQDSFLLSRLSRWSAYEGLCYVVFEDFNLGSSPTLPALSFEVQARAISTSGYTSTDSREYLPRSSDIGDIGGGEIIGGDPIIGDGDIGTGEETSTEVDGIYYIYDGWIDQMLYDSVSRLWYPSWQIDGDVTFFNAIVYEEIYIDDTKRRILSRVYSAGEIVDTGDCTVELVVSASAQRAAVVKGTVCGCIGIGDFWSFGAPVGGASSNDYASSWDMHWLKYNYKSMWMERGDGQTAALYNCTVSSMFHALRKSQTDSIYITNGIGYKAEHVFPTDFSIYYPDEQTLGKVTLAYQYIYPVEPYAPYLVETSVGRGAYGHKFENTVKKLQFATFGTMEELEGGHPFFVYVMNMCVPYAESGVIFTGMDTGVIPFLSPKYKAEMFLGYISDVASDDYPVAHVLSTVLSNQKSGSGGLSFNIDYNQYLAYSASKSVPVLVSALIDSQTTALALVDELLTYDNGYLSVDYESGSIYLLPIDDNSGTYLNPLTLTQDVPQQLYLADVLTADDIDITRKAIDSSKNHVRVNFTNRDKKYDRSVANSENELDAANTGKREAQASMMHCCKSDIAAAIADEYLQRNMQLPAELKLDTSIKYYDILRVGCVVTLMDEIAETAYTARVIHTSLSDDYKLSVTLQQVVAWDSTAYTPPPTEETEQYTEAGIAQTVSTAYIFELPMFVTGGKCGYVLAVVPNSEDDSWAGSVIYQSQDGETYSRVDITTSAAVSGMVSEVGLDSIVVYVDSDVSLPSSTSADTMTAGGYSRLIYLPDSDMFIRYGRAVQTDARTWTLDWLVWDVFTAPTFGTAGQIAAGDTLLFLDVSASPYFLEKSQTLAGSRYYYKFPSVSPSGSVQDLSECDVYSDDYGADGARPLAVFGIAVNGLGSADKYSSGDYEITWHSRNRLVANTVYDDSSLVGFRVEILVSGSVVRSQMVVTKAWTYTTAMQTADGSHAEFTVRITKVCSDMESVAAVKTIKVVI